MALYWYDGGNKLNAPWREKQAEVQKTSSKNPYAKQQEKNDEQDVKVIFAHQLMKKSVITMLPNTPLSEALRILKNNKIRHAPIVNSERSIVGIISDRDIMRKWAGIGDTFIDWIQESDNAKAPVSTCMSKKVLTAEPDVHIIDIARAMFSEKVGCMPVVGSEQTVLGIITRTDILRLIVRTAPTHFWL